MLTYAIVLLIVGAALVVMEVFLPSGGILGLMAAAAVGASLYFAFRESETTGVVFLIVVALGGPALVVLGFKVFPHTPVGKRLILRPGGAATPAVRRQPPPTADADAYAKLMGREAVAVTPLRPSGIIEIDDERYSAIALGQLLDRGARVKVVNVEGNNVIVEEAAS